MSEESIVLLVGHVIRAAGLVAVAAIVTPVLRFGIQKWYEVRKLELRD